MPSSCLPWRAHCILHFDRTKLPPVSVIDWPLGLPPWDCREGNCKLPDSIAILGISNWEAPRFLPSSRVAFVYTFIPNALCYSLTLLTLEKRKIAERVCWVSVSLSQIHGVVFSSSSSATCWLHEFKHLNSFASWLHLPLNGTIYIHLYSPIAHSVHWGDDILAGNKQQRKWCSPAMGPQEVM